MSAYDRAVASAVVGIAEQVLKPVTHGPKVSVLAIIARQSNAAAHIVVDAHSTYHSLGLMRTSLGPSDFLVQRAWLANEALRTLAKGANVDVQRRLLDVVNNRARAIAAGSATLEAAAAARAAEIAHDSARVTARLARAPSSRDVRALAGVIDEALGSPGRFLLTPAHGDALDLFLREVSLNGAGPLEHLEQVLEPLLDNLSRLNAAGRKLLGVLQEGKLSQLDAAAFAGVFGPERNYVKGVIGEIWFYRSASTASVREVLELGAMHAAEQLSRSGEEIVGGWHLGPLFENGKQLFDGAYFVRRSAQSHPDFFEIQLTALVEVKTGDRFENVWQLFKDQARENARIRSGQALNSFDGTLYRLTTPHGFEDPVRVFVAPALPPASILRQLGARGIKPVFVPTALDKEQFGMLADFFLLVLLSRA